MQKVEQKKERGANLELLRIISMVLIVMSHSDDWMGLAEKYKYTVCINKSITDWLNMGGQIGVGCFLLISGYFMVDQQFNLKRIFRLLGEVWFYTLSFFAVYVIAKVVMGEFTLVSGFKQAVFGFFPVLFSHYWFVTAYVILMFLAPFFNKLIDTMDKHTYQMLLAAIIVIFCVIDGGIPKALRGMSNGRLIPVFIMYFIAGYIKKYVSADKNNAGKHLGIAILGYLVLYATFVVIELVGAALDSKIIMENCYFWRPLNSPIVLVINVELFLAFLRMKNVKGKVINSIASNTFGVYLIHTNTIVGGIILPKIFPVYKETNSLKLLIYALGSVVTVYITCTLIDMARQRTAERLWLKILNAKYEKFEIKANKIISHISGNVIKILRKYYG